MLILQSLAYAMLAGLPPRGRALRLAPADPHLCRALHQPGAGRGAGRGDLAADCLGIGRVAAQGTAGYAAAALTLALMSGVILFGMGLMRLGFLANVLSHPVISGFISASRILSAAGQIQHLLGIDAGRQRDLPAGLRRPPA